MFTSVLTFLKTSLFTRNGVFILGFLAFISVFLIFNSETILTKFGFQTKTAAVVELAETKAELQTAVRANEELVIAIEEMQIVHREERAAIRTVTQERQVIQRQVNRVIEERKVQAIIPERTIMNEIVVTETTVTIPRAEYDQLSRQNISSIHAAFQSLNLSS